MIHALMHTGRVKSAKVSGAAALCWTSLVIEQGRAGEEEGSRRDTRLQILRFPPLPDDAKTPKKKII